MFNAILFLLCILPLILYAIKMKNYKFKLKEIIIIAMLSSMSYILSLIPIIKYPQDGGINMFSMLPLLLVSLIYSRQAGITAGVIAGTISLIMGGYIVHPAQILLDYILPEMILGFSDMFGKNKKLNIILGSLVAVLLNTTLHFISGVIFFGQFAPEGVGPVLYSFLYNFSGSGVEGVLCVVILSVLPISRLRKISSM